MKRPPYGLSLPVELVNVRDGDTIVVRAPGSSYEWAIRLLDCWAAEKNTDAGKAAKAYVERVLANAGDLSLWVPAPKHIHNLLKNITFDRILGHLWLDDHTTLSEVMVDAGHALKEKPKDGKEPADAR